MIDRQIIAQLLAEMHLPGKVVNIQPLAGGISASMTLVTIEAPRGDIIQWVIRQLSAETLALRPNAVEMEYGLLQVLKSHGLPVSRPIYLDVQGNIFDTPTLVMDYLPGEMDFSTLSQLNRGSEIARVLAQIHAIDLNEINRIAVPRLEKSFFGLCGEDPKIPDEELNETLIRNELKQHWPPKNQNPPVLLHGDIWNGNILWQGKKISGIIDWEDAWIGDPLLDIAGARSDQVYTYGMEMADQLTKIYLDLRKIDARDLPLWDLVAVLWLIHFINHDLPAWAAFFHHYGRTDITAESIKRDINSFSNQALEQLS